MAKTLGLYAQAPSYASAVIFGMSGLFRMKGPLLSLIWFGLFKVIWRSVESDETARAIA